MIGSALIRRIPSADYPRPAYERALALIEAMDNDAAPYVLHGALKAVIIAEANDVDAVAERHRGGGHD